jgi:FkbM family methyltransferase
MTYRVPLPEGGRRTHLDLIEPNSTAVQRFIRRSGLGAYEPSTSAALLTVCEAADPGFVMFDVGANMGLYGGLAASMFDPRLVHAFEPAPATASVARRIAKRNRLPVEVHEIALSSRTGTAQLHISPVSDASNSLVPGFRDTDVRIDVATTTLDAFVDLTGDHPDILKIDVETHELAVLEGGRRTIEQDRPVIILEVLRRRGHDHGVEITEFLDGLGYRCFELSASPVWSAHPGVRGSGTDDRDWLLLPNDLDPGFTARWERWRRRLEVCGPENNPRVPVVPSVRAALRRGGWKEVWSTAGRYWRSRAAAR